MPSFKSHWIRRANLSHAFIHKHITHHTSHITHHTSHMTHHSSHITHLTLHITQCFLPGASPDAVTLQFIAPHMPVPLIFSDNQTLRDVLRPPCTTLSASFFQCYFVTFIEVREAFKKHSGRDVVKQSAVSLTPNFTTNFPF